MKYLLDTNACVEILRGRGDPIWKKIASLPEDQVTLCAPVHFELLFGARRSKDREQNTQKVAAFLSEFPSLPFDDQSAAHAAEIRAHLAANGTSIGPSDLLIAAIARSAGLTVVTHNKNEFARVPGLPVEDWQIAT